MFDKSKGDQKENLQIAIENLEEFANQNEFATFPNILNLDVENDQLISTRQSKLQGTIDLTRHFISSLLSKPDPQFDTRKVKVQHTILQSIEYLKTHYRLIEKLKQGSKAEQDLAQWALEAIGRYNILIQKAKEEPTSLGSRVARFVYEQSGVSLDEELKNNPIEFPRTYSIQISTNLNNQSTTNKIAALKLPSAGPGVPPTKHEVDALHMKAITLLRNPDFPQSLRSTLSSLLKETPISTTILQTNVTLDDSAAIVSLEQTISPFPGEVITVQGQFKRNAKSNVPSVPIPDSFHVSTKAFQTGFPHPLQHTGWALADVLVPAFPNRLALIPLFEEIYRKKLKMAHELLPAGSLNDKGKRILRLKKKLFEEQADPLLTAHEMLFHAVIKSAHLPEKEEVRGLEITTLYLNSLRKHTKAYEQLAHTHSLINEAFFTAPYNKLQEESLERKLPDMGSSDPKAVYQACISILENEIAQAINEITVQKNKISDQQEVLTLDYMLHLGTIIGNAGKAVILQQFSEKMGFPPLLLTNFEQKLQVCTYQHLIAFQKEMDISLPEDDAESREIITQFLFDHLKNEITLFSAETPDNTKDLAVKISHELEIYYNSRYFYLLHHQREINDLSSNNSNE